MHDNNFWNLIIIPFQEMDLPLIKLASTEIVSGVSGESEERLRDLFEKAVVGYRKH